MLIPNHPEDERLSALASREPEAVADPTLDAHVSACARCTGVVDELAALRVSLSDLPDLRPSRPLRLVPDVLDEQPGTADRLGRWARRFFAPVLTAGAALAMVGLIGTAAPGLDGMASGGAQEDSAALEAASPEGGAGAGAPAAAEASDGAAAGDGESADGGGRALSASDDAGTNAVAAGDDDSPVTQLPAERSPWPMVLFSGLALMIGAVLLRWILVPRLS